MILHTLGPPPKISPGAWTRGLNQNSFGLKALNDHVKRLMANFLNFLQPMENPIQSAPN